MYKHIEGTFAEDLFVAAVPGAVVAIEEEEEEEEGLETLLGMIHRLSGH